MDNFLRLSHNIEMDILTKSFSVGFFEETEIGCLKWWLSGNYMDEAFLYSKDSEREKSEYKARRYFLRGFKSGSRI